LSQPLTGLTAAEVAERIAQGKTNAYKARVGRSYWDIFRDNILNLFNIIMATLLLVVLLFGDYATVFFAGFSFVTNSLLGMIQEMNAKRRLDKLAAMAASEIKVIRDGKPQMIKMEAVVCDDILPIQPGDRIVVDGVILTSDALEIDESQLTGESDAVLKEAGSEVHSGSFCIAGSGIMRATKVGRESTVNRLSATAKQYKRVLTPTQRRLSYIVQLSVGVMVILTPMIFITGILDYGNPFTLEVFRNAVVFIASIVPQGLVLTAILSLTIGAISISRFQTLVQRVNAVESMANVTVLCFDKTGTLTRNKLSVCSIIPLNSAGEDVIRDRLKMYVDNLSNLNSTASAVSHHVGGSHDSLHPLITNSAAKITKLREVPFTSQRKWGAVTFAEETLILGAPERVLKPSDNGALERARALSMQGYRVLAFAHSTQPMGDHKSEQHLHEEREAIALIVLQDEIRDDIQDTLDQFRAQNVALKVISGDNLETVRQIATQSGMEIRKAYTGDQLEQMDEIEFASAALEGDAFARIEPETKRKLIAAMKAHGAYVAMVGDGVNDVPALKEAHMAVVMNDGAQISKDVGDIVLLNNAMSTLPRAFFEGRVITQTIFATSKMFLVKNLYTLLFFVYTGFMGIPFPINPIQISWLSFGVINVPGALYALRILKPLPMKEFRRDVLDYVLTAGIIGSAMMALITAIVYITSGADLLITRSVVFLFLILYGMMALWHIQGVDLSRWSTIRAHMRSFIFGWAAAILTIWAAYMAPGVLTFVGPSLTQWALITAIFLLAVVLVQLIMHTRALPNLIWKLTSK